MYKKFKKDATLSIRCAGELIDRLDDLTDKFQLDRADLIRMLLSNALKYWESKFDGTPVQPRSNDMKSGFEKEPTRDEIAQLQKMMEQFK